ncbi:MAG: hypothetical protein GW778_01595 [Alphaproteobacteria bacterium]|nr:hypothetical protein [Alphaproteobacteria bacterium]
MINRKSLVLFIASISPFLLLACSPSSLRLDPLLDVPYEQARQLVLNDGWQPIEHAMDDDLVFVTGRVYEKGFTEVDVCSPVGDTPCKFYFKGEDRRFLEILTKGEDLRVVSVAVLDKRAYENARPYRR